MNEAASVCKLAESKYLYSHLDPRPSNSIRHSPAEPAEAINPAVLLLGFHTAYLFVCVRINVMNTDL